MKHHRFAEARPPVQRLLDAPGDDALHVNAAEILVDLHTIAWTSAARFRRYARAWPRRRSDAGAGVLATLAPRSRRPEYVTGARTSSLRCHVVRSTSALASSSSSGRSCTR